MVMRAIAGRDTQYKRELENDTVNMEEDGEDTGDSDENNTQGKKRLE
jgi:hypothetical protein